LSIDRIASVSVTLLRYLRVVERLVWGLRIRTREWRRGAGDHGVCPHAYQSALGWGFETINGKIPLMAEFDHHLGNRYQEFAFFRSTIGTVIRT
jgi:hypothetical protein